MTGNVARDDGYPEPSEHFNEGESAGNPSVLHVKEIFFVPFVVRSPIPAFRDD